MVDLSTITLAVAAVLFLVGILTASGFAADDATVDGAYLAYHRGVPAAWDCSTPITLAVNPAGIDAETLTDVYAAIATINAASPFTFEITGFTDLVPDLESRPVRQAGDPMVVFAFVNSIDHPTRFPDHVVAGNGGSWWRLGGHGPRIYAGSVLIALNSLDRFSPGDGPMSRQALVIHELFHVLNLGHQESGDTIMTPTLRANAGVIGADDRVHLQALADIACPGVR